jgi:hypothetical protein
MYQAEQRALQIIDATKFRIMDTWVGDILNILLGLFEFVLIAACALGIVILPWCCMKANNGKAAARIAANNIQPVAVVNTQPKTDASKTGVTSYADADKMIWSTLRAVALKYKANHDANYDGLTNCIDASIWFYELYPIKADVCIERNSKMLHAFNCVKMDGVWRAIEPQAVATGWTTTYFMRDIWKNYDTAYNEDAWYKYGKFVK